MITFTRENSRGIERAYELPSRFEVCDTCHGTGFELCEGMRGHAYSAEEFTESFDDEERAEYFRPGGCYDVTCSACHGRNVIAVVDEDEANRTRRGRRLLALYWAVTEANAATFDRSNLISVACSQCAALVINGVACHETGCPNAMKECRGCNNLIPARPWAKYCEDCQ